jgi:hypothetical protein
VSANRKRALRLVLYTFALLLIVGAARVASTGLVTVHESYRCFTVANAKLPSALSEQEATSRFGPMGGYLAGHQIEQGTNTLFYFERFRYASHPFMTQHQLSHKTLSLGHLSIELPAHLINEPEAKVALDQWPLHASTSGLPGYGFDVTYPWGSTLFLLPHHAGKKSGSLQIKDNTWSGMIEFAPLADDVREDPSYFPGAVQRIRFSCSPKRVERAEFEKCAGQVWWACSEKYWLKREEAEPVRTVLCPPSISEHARFCQYLPVRLWEYVTPSAVSS